MDTIKGVGKIVSWVSPKEVAFSTLRAAIVDCGFDAKYAREMLPRDAFSRAARELSDQRIIRRIDEDADEVHFQFTREWLSANEFLYAKECDMYVNKVTGAVRSDDYELAERAHELLLSHQAKRKKSDITRLIQRIFKDRKGDLVPLTDNGGAYFVPECHDQIVKQVADLLNAIGGKLKPRLISANDKDTDESVAQDMADHMLSLIDDFRASCKNFCSETSDRVRQNRLDELLELRDKLKGYDGLLSSFRDSIASEIDAAEDEVCRALAGGEYAVA